MRSVVASAVLAILLASAVAGRPLVGLSPTTHSEDPVSMQEIERDWTVNIILVNYNSDVIQDTALYECLPTQREHIAEICDISYSIQYKVFHADSSYIESIRNLILENHINGSTTGTTLDEEALEYQKANPEEPQRIFYPRAGMSIEADPIEEWLIENPLVVSSGLHYNLYLFNFSEFDSPDHELEHWYDYNPVDPDSGEEIDWWRLEWDNELNRDVKLQYAGFGGKDNVFVLDLSADQWYLRWARIWWGTAPYDQYPRHCTEDLEDVVAGLNLSSSEGQWELSAYLGNYLSDIVRYVFFPVQHQPTAFVDTGSLTTLVIAMDTDSGIPLSSLTWVTREDLLEGFLSELLPFIPWNVTVQFRDHVHLPDIMDLFDEHSYVEKGHTWVDGYALFEDIYQNVRWRYVDIFDENINVFGVVFIKQNMTMYTPMGSFTGLGGGGQTCVLKSWERYYRDNETTKREGVSGVQLHETMHAIGMGHTWDYRHYVGDFSSSPMGYFGMHNGTSSFDKNWVQGTYLDQMEYDYYQDFLDAWDAIRDRAGPETLQIKNSVMEYYDLAREKYESMDWQGCHDALQQAKQKKHDMMFSITDTNAPTIWNWGYEPDDFAGGDLSVWADVSDDIAGVKNVTALVRLNETTLAFMCTHNGSLWTADLTIGAFQPEHGVQVTMQAYDRGLNLATTDWLTLVEPTSDTSNGTYTPYIMMFTIPFSLVLVVLVVIWFKKRGAQAQVSW